MLRERKVTNGIPIAILDLNTNQKTKIGVGDGFLDDVPTGTGIKQGDLIRPLIVSIVMAK